MSLKKLNVRGFAGIEAILIVLIVAIIGGTGYYVYHSNKKANSTYNAASKTASSKTSRGATGGKGGETGDLHPQTGPAKTEVFIIHEWGVAAEIPAPPKQAALIQYKILTTTPTTAAFTTQEMIDNNSACGLDAAPAGIVSRAKGSDPFYLPDGTPSGKTVSQELATGTYKPYKQVGKYYYWYSHAQAACGNTSADIQLQSLASKEVQIIITKLETE